MPLGVPCPLPLSERLLEESPLCPHEYQFQQELLEIIVAESEIEMVLGVLFELVYHEVAEVVGDHPLVRGENTGHFGVGFDVVLLVLSKKTHREFLDGG